MDSGRDVGIRDLLNRVVTRSGFTVYGIVRLKRAMFSLGRDGHLAQTPEDGAGLYTDCRSARRYENFLFPFPPLEFPPSRQSYGIGLIQSTS